MGTSYDGCGASNGALQFLGGRHRTELPANAIEPKEAVS
jgi:hypothetical protein